MLVYQRVIIKINHSFVSTQFSDNPMLRSEAEDHQKTRSLTHMASLTVDTLQTRDSLLVIYPHIH